MAAASAARAISPSNASTSRTRCPLPRPPIAGLQLIAPREPRSKLTRPTRAPIRAATLAASQPAWPPPTTRMSNALMPRPLIRPGAPVKMPAAFHVKQPSLSNAEAPEQRVEHVLRRAAADQPVECQPRLAQALGKQQRIGLPDGLTQRATRLRQQVTLPPVQGPLTRSRHHRGGVSNQPALQFDKVL